MSRPEAINFPVRSIFINSFSFQAPVSVSLSGDRFGESSYPTDRTTLLDGYWLWHPIYPVRKYLVEPQVVIQWLDALNEVLSRQVQDLVE